MLCWTYVKPCTIVTYTAMLAVNQIHVNCSADSLIFVTVRTYEYVLASPGYTVKIFNSSRLSSKIHKLHDVIYI
jgi:hypothetical protein